MVAEGERLSFGHLANPAFATEIALIDPLPHQRLAVYEHMLRQPRLRFLLADDAGAGKTIMAGLYVREMLSRRLIRRVLIVSPAGLVGNWRRELAKLFTLTLEEIIGADAKKGNPFVLPESDLAIVSVDTLAGTNVFSRLREPEVPPYDLVVFDEAHKLSANRGADLRVDKTDRYRLAEALAGVPDVGERWRLPWRAQHLLLLTATPHMGKDYPYYALWRLLEPEVFSTPEAFAECPPDRRRQHFIRRTKEEMVRLDGTPIYPTRVSDTLGYELTQGEVSEQKLYDETTEYLREVYNRAKVLNRSAARLAMSVFQRRLASSTWALLRSFDRRLEKLDALITDIQEGRLTEDQLLMLQRRLDQEADDVLESRTGDEEREEDGREENEFAEDRLLRGVVATCLADLLAEKEQVKGLRDLAQQVHNQGHESKFERLREVIADPRYADEKFLVFTEHRDTLELLVRRLEGLGYTGEVAQIHGGMPYQDRDAQVVRFWKPAAEGGTRILVCTDAAGEGINLQVCWTMVNYDVPWNPARLEQRMGRIHRYGQQHDPVRIVNLVAPATREGKVLKTLLDKLERIRQEFGSDKVFDVIGRVFAGVSIKDYMVQALAEGDAEKPAGRLDGTLTTEQVQAIAARERALYGDGGEVARELSRLRQDLEQETYHRLLPGYVRHFLESAAPLVDVEIVGDLDARFALRPATPAATHPLTRALDACPAEQRESLSVVRPSGKGEALWVRPGEPVFESVRCLVAERLGEEARRGAVFVDPTTEQPYLFHLARVSVVRQADSGFAELAKEEALECRLVGLKQFETGDLEVCSVEHLLLLSAGHGLPAPAQRLALAAGELKERARAHLADRVARDPVTQHAEALRATLPEREDFVRRGFDFHEAELAAARAKLSAKARDGDHAAQRELDRVKAQQRELSRRREHALTVLRREPELIRPGEATFVVHALVVPSPDPADKVRYDANAEQVAMNLAIAYEQSFGATVHDVHTPPLARAAGLPDHPGFDLLSVRPDGETCSIEVKGRAGADEVELLATEWSRACNLRDRYWLYAVYDCATPQPRLFRVQDPFGALLAKAKGSVLIGAKQVMEAAGGP